MATTMSDIAPELQPTSLDPDVQNLKSGHTVINLDKHIGSEPTCKRNYCILTYMKINIAWIILRIKRDELLWHGW